MTNSRDLMHAVVFDDFDIVSHFKRITHKKNCMRSRTVVRRWADLPVWQVWLAFSHRHWALHACYSDFFFFNTNLSFNTFFLHIHLLTDKLSPVVFMVYVCIVPKTISGQLTWIVLVDLNINCPSDVVGVWWAYLWILSWWMFPVVSWITDLIWSVNIQMWQTGCLFCCPLPGCRLSRAV